jgi:hypothetical protein
MMASVAMRSVAGFTWALLISLGCPGSDLFTTARAEAQSSAFRAITCTDLGPATLPPRDVVPVVVSYMQNSRRPDDDVTKRLSQERLRRAFEPSGEFNAVWSAHGIRFALAGFRTCRYTLDPSQDRPEARPDIPDPELNLTGVFLKVLQDNNTRAVKVGPDTVAFRGVDLYVWWDIQHRSGYGVRPRFGKTNEESGRRDELKNGRVGGIWIGARCGEVSPDHQKDTCAGVFAHEAGHFLGLCHCCHQVVERGNSPVCFNYIRPSYCPGLGPSSGVDCGVDDESRLMSATNLFTSPVKLQVKDCEKDAALLGKEKVLKFGANGVRHSQ